MLKVTGIICEYNPLHLGHKKQIDLIRAAEPDGIIVCLMSGNYVQRGKPAIVDKSLRAKAAILAGADLVLYLIFVKYVVQNLYTKHFLLVHCLLYICIFSLCNYI